MAKWNLANDSALEYISQLLLGALGSTWPLYEDPFIILGRVEFLACF